MANVILDFSESKTDDSKPHMGALRYEKGRRYNFDMSLHGDFARACVMSGAALPTAGDDEAALAALMKLVPRPNAPVVSVAPAPAPAEPVDPSLVAEDEKP